MISGKNFKDTSDDIDNKPFVQGMDRIYLMGENSFEDTNTKLSEEEFEMRNFNTYFGSLPTKKTFTDKKLEGLLHKSYKGECNATNKIIANYSRRIINEARTAIETNPLMWRQIVSGAYLGFTKSIPLFFLHEEDILKNRNEVIKVARNGINKGIENEINSYFEKELGETYIDDKAYASVDTETDWNKEFFEKSDCLNSEEKKVFGMYKDVGGYSGPWEFDEIGAALQLPKNKVQAIYDKALYKLENSDKRV